MATSKTRNESVGTNYSLSHYFSCLTKIIFTCLLLSTMGLLIFSNLHRAEYVQAIITPTSNVNNTAIDSLIGDHILEIFNNKHLIKSNIKDEYSIQVFTITIPSSIHDFWQSEAYELAIVIAAASLIWPYIKLIILLFVWLYPLPQNKRTKIILFIDQAGKWSYMDLYASVVMTVCFYVHIIHIQRLTIGHSNGVRTRYWNCYIRHCQLIINGV